MTVLVFDRFKVLQFYKLAIFTSSDFMVYLKVEFLDTFFLESISSSSSKTGNKTNKSS